MYLISFNSLDFFSHLFFTGIRVEDDGLYVCALYVKKSKTLIAEKTVDVVVIRRLTVNV